MKQYEYLGRMIKIPERYKWVAIDSNGAIFAYERKPEIGERTWRASGAMFGLFGTDPCEGWKDTLRHVSDLPVIEPQPEAAQPDKPMTTLPAGTVITVDAGTYYLTEGIAVPTTTEPPKKTAEELACEWSRRVAPVGDLRFYIDLGGNAQHGSFITALQCANTWPIRAIAERRAKQIKAQNLLILAAMECNAKHSPEPNGAGYYVDYSSMSKPWDDGWGVFPAKEAGTGVVRFNRCEDAVEAMNHLRALGLLDYLVLDMEGGE